MIKSKQELKVLENHLIACKQVLKYIKEELESNSTKNHKIQSIKKYIKEVENLL